MNLEWVKNMKLDSELTQSELTTLLEIKSNVLRDMRCTYGGGPPYIKRLGRIFYRVSTVIKWIERQGIEFDPSKRAIVKRRKQAKAVRAQLKRIRNESK